MHLHISLMLSGTSTFKPCALAFAPHGCLSEELATLYLFAHGYSKPFMLLVRILCHS
jgi:hypothetical protein